MPEFVTYVGLKALPYLSKLDKDIKLGNKKVASVQLKKHISTMANLVNIDTTSLKQSVSGRVTSDGGFTMGAGGGNINPKSHQPTSTYAEPQDTGARGTMYSSKTLNQHMDNVIAQYNNVVTLAIKKALAHKG